MHQCCTRQTQRIRAGIMCNYPLAKELENTNITFKAGQFQWIILYNVVNFKTCPLVVHSDNFHTDVFFKNKTDIIQRLQLVVLGDATVVGCKLYSVTSDPETQREGLEEGNGEKEG